MRTTQFAAIVSKIKYSNFLIKVVKEETAP